MYMYIHVHVCNYQCTFHGPECIETSLVVDAVYLFQMPTKCFDLLTPVNTSFLPIFKVSFLGKGYVFGVHVLRIPLRD